MVNIDNLLKIGSDILKTDKIIKATEFAHDGKEVETIMQEVKKQLIQDLIEEYHNPTESSFQPLTMDDFTKGFEKLYPSEPKKATVAKKTTVSKKAATTRRNTTKK